VNIYYYDERAGRQRMKRRYVWAAWAFGAGFIFGLALSGLL
jgi:hypothetical protein